MIVIAKKVGRLGNRLILFAHFIGAALEHGLEVANPAFHPYARHFPSTARDLLCRFPAGRRQPSVPGARFLLYRATLLAGSGLHLLQRAGVDAGLVRLRRDQHLDLNSREFLEQVRRHRVLFVQDWFFRNADNCARHREAIRSFFRPWDHHLARATATIEPARTRGRLVVGVHIRQGDYQTFKGGRLYFSRQQYRGVMAQVEDLFADREVTFLVCADEPAPRGAFAGFDVTHGTGHLIEDLYALSQCDRLIGPPSTFNTWASYYGDVPLYRIRDAEAQVSQSSFRIRTGAH